MLQVRRVTEAEDALLGGLTALLQDAVEGGASVGFMAPLSAEDARRYWSQALRQLRDGLALWVAERDGEIVGSVQLVPCAKPNGRHRAEVQKLFVCRAHRGSGIAKQLMLAVERYARDDSRTLLVLDTQTGSAAEALYRRLGWRYAGSVPRYAVTPGGELHPTSYYFKDISPGDGAPRNDVATAPPAWRGTQAESRARYLAKFDPAEVERYDASVGRLSRDDEDAYLSDLARVVQLHPGASVLDVGAGSGTLSSILARLPGLAITALEPAPAMLARLRSKPELAPVTTVEGFCDAVEDRRHFDTAQFDVILSRQLVNGLFDPIAAFRNWHHWLRPGGAVVVIDGLYGRASWTGVWQEEVDVLPLSACQGIATTPYLLEVAGLRVEHVELMRAVNARPATRTPRYVAVAAKAS